MGLSEEYGVLIDTKCGYKRDDPNNFGRYHHNHLFTTSDTV